MYRRVCCLVAASLVAVSPAPAQEREPSRAEIEEERGLPQEVAASLSRLLEDPATVRFDGDRQIPSGDTVRANVVARGGLLDLSGRIEGDLVVLNGDLRLSPGAAVTGTVTVVGGSLDGSDGASIGGEIRVYGRAFRFAGGGEQEGEEGRDRGAIQSWGRSDFLIATGKSYNRVEGLPITFGPRIRTAGSNPLRAHALAVYRTESGLTLDPEEMGYSVQVEHYLGGRRAVRIGVNAQSLVDPIEDWQLSDLESGLSTFLFHEDYRDHYERRGVGAFAIWRRPGSPLEIGLEAHREKHRSLASGTPWSLTDNADPWRAQPLVGEGVLNTLRTSATFDTRSTKVDPASGWYVRARVEQALGSDLVRPGAYLEVAESSISTIAGELSPLELGRFSAGSIDLRRYNRVDPGSRLNLRLLAAGSLDGRTLPPQRQHALGGEGSLPGYSLFHQDCGAREELVYRGGLPGAGTPFFPRYGCDAFALLQAEYRGKFSFRFLWDSVPWADDAESDEDWGFVWDLSPDWTFFVDAAQAWSFGSGPDEEIAADVGIGILLNRFGIFVALPLTGGDGLNVFARIGPRF